MRNILFTLMLFLTPFQIIAGTIDPNNSDAEYVEYGKKFDSVVVISGEYNDGTLFQASAVVIEPKWVLTAAHIVHNARRVSIEVDESKYRVSRIIVHPDFIFAVFNGNDIALLSLEDKISLTNYPELYSDTDEVGKLCSIAGYGVTGTFETGSKTSDNKRRAGMNIVDDIESDLLICSPSKENPTDMEFLTSHGDSGGGLFIDKKLAGIHSCVFAIDKNANSSYRDWSGHTRISKHRNWIKERIGR